MADVNISKYRASVVRDGSKPATPGFVVSEGQDPVNPPGTNNYVPYTGATANVELGEYGLESGFVTLDTTPTNTPTDQGTIYWDDARSTAALIMNGTLQHIGQDTFFYVKNSSGSSIPKGTCVRFAGTDGASGHILISPFLANGSVPSSYFMGVTSETIANGSFGQVMHFGELEGINTSAFTAGALLYASTTVAGGFQTTPPVAPNNIVLVAAAINSTNNGAIIVRPQIGSNINNDEGVKITSVADKNLLQYQSATGLWENKTVAQVLGGNPITGSGSLNFVPKFTSGLGTIGNSSIQDNGSNITLGLETIVVGNISASNLSGTNTGNVTIGTANGLSISGQILSLGLASGSSNGALSSTDWNTFNNKQNALTNPVTGTGTTNYLAKFTGSTTIGNSGIFESGGNVSIGNASPVSIGNYRTLLLQGGSTTQGGLIQLQNSDSSCRAYWFNTNDSSTLKTVTNHQLIFGANNTDYLYLNSSGNLGLGVTPSAWGGFTASAFQVRSAFMQVDIGNNAGFGRNAYQSSSGWLYQGNGFATMMNIEADGAIKWFNAPSGTANAAISFTQAMTLTSGGNLLVGTTTDNGQRLQVNGSIRSGFANTSALLVQSNGTATTGAAIAIQQLTGEGDTIIFGDYEPFAEYGIIARNSLDSIDFTGGTTNGSLENYNITNRSGNVRTAYVKARIGLGSGITAFGGNVGIGTTSPAAKLDIAGGDLYVRTGGTIYANTFGPYSGNMTISLGGSGNNLIVSGGNVLIGTTTDNGARLQVNGTSTFGGDVQLNQTLSTIKTSANNSVLILLANPNLVDNEVRMEMVGRTYSSDSNSIFYRANTHTFTGSNASLGARMTINSSGVNISSLGTGTVYSNGGTLTNTNPSDFNLKENIAPINYGLGEILQLKPVTFNWKNDTINQGKQYGFIAQEVQKIMPDLVKKGEYLGLDKEAIFTTLVKAIQELNQKFDNLKN